MNGKTVLFAWELGEGVGYLADLVSIAAKLAAAGCTPVLALRSIDHAPRLAAGHDWPVLQAPWIVGRLSPEARRHGFAPTGFADLMAVNGYGSEDHLRSILRGWRGLIDVVRPDLIVATYAPTVTLAAHGRIPVVLFGSGYLTPPAGAETFPRFRDDVAAYANQEVLLEVARAVQRSFGAAQPETITDVYRGDRRVIVSLPELDPYQATRNEACAGLFDDCSPPTTEHADRFYAYLAGTGRRAAGVAGELAASALPGEMFVRDADMASVAASPGLRLLEAPPDVFDATRRAAVIVHHGGLGATQAALAAGRPQVLAPQALDQLLTARRLEDRSFVKLAPPGVVADAVRTLMADDGARAAAMSFATSIRARGLHGARARIVEACFDLLS